MVIGIDIDDLLASSGRPIIAHNAAESIGERSLRNHCKINQLPLAAYGDIHFHDMLVAVLVDDLFGIASFPGEGSKRRTKVPSVCQGCTGHLSDVSELPLSSNANIKLYNMASVVNIGDLLTSSSRPIIADNVCSLSQGSTGEYGKINDLPLTSWADMHLLNMVVVINVDNLFSVACGPLKAGQGGAINQRGRSERS